MSVNIDQNLVELSFDNSDFERKAKTSMETLSNLNKSLNFESAGAGLDAIGSKIGSISFDAMILGVGKVTTGFSGLADTALGTLFSLASQVTSVGEEISSLLTLDAGSVSDGFNEYELKMGSVQTIMNGTGASLDTVMDKLNDLNTYADNTIYSFSDMTASIGKFTNNGVDLDVAVEAIKGISNEAALSGANAQQASAAMYNFSQALSAGYVQLIDWKSIETANMATEGFKQQLIETAVEAGTLADNLDGTYSVISTNNDGSTMDTAITATSNFNDSLQYQWMTADVLTTTLSKYSDTTTELGQQATAAAQDVTTFSGLMDAFRESVGSGWATTWEIIFGDFNEAKKMWTSLSNVLTGIASAESDARNAVLTEWDALGGRTAMLNSVANVYKGLLTVFKPVKEAWQDIIPPMTGEKLANLTKRIEEITSKMKLSSKQAENVKGVFYGVFAVFNILGHTLVTIAKLLEPVVFILGGLANTLLTVLGPLGRTVAGSQELAETWIDNALAELAAKIADAFEQLGQKLKDFGAALKPHIDAVKEFAAALSEGLNDPWVQFVISQYKDWLVWFSKDSIGLLANSIKEYIGRLFPVGRDLAGVLYQFILDITNLGFLDAFKIFKTNIKYVFKEFITVTKESFEGFMESLKQLYDLRFVSSGLNPDQLFWVTVGAIKNVVEGIKPYVEDTALYEPLTKFANAFHDFFAMIERDFGDVPGQIADKLKDIKDKIKSALADFLVDLVFDTDTPYNYTTFGQDMVQGYADGLKDDDGIIEKSIKILYERMVKSFKKMVKDVKGAIVDLVFNTDTPYDYTTFGQDMVQGYADGLKDDDGIVLKALKILFDRLVDYMKDMPDKFKETAISFGSYVVEGFIEGLTGKDGLLHDIVTKLFESVLDKIKEIFDINSPSKKAEEIGGYVVEGFVNGVAKASEALDTVGGVFKTVLGVMWKAAQVVAPVLETVGKALYNFGSTALEVVGPAIRSLNFDDVMAIVELLKDLATAEFLHSMSSNSDGIFSFMDSITDLFYKITDFSPLAFLDDLKASLFGFQKDVKPNSLMSIAAAMLLFAAAVGIIAASVVALSGMSVEQAEVAVGAIGAIVAVMATMEVLMTKFAKLDAKKMILASVGMILAIGSIKQLADVVVQLGAIDPVNLAASVAAVYTLGDIMTAMLDASKTGEKSKGMDLSVGVGMIMIAEAMRLICDAVAVMGDMDPTTLVKGIASISALLLSMSKILSSSKDSKLTIQSSIAFLSLSKGLGMMAESVKELAAIDIPTLIVGITSVSAILAGVGFASKGISKLDAGSALGILAVAEAVKMLGNFAQVLGTMDIPTLIQGGIAISVIMAELATLSAVIGESGFDASSGVGVAAVAVALNLLVGPLQSFGEMDIPTLAKGLITLGVALAELAIATSEMEGTVEGAAAMMIAVVAIKMLVGVMEKIADMSIWDIIKGLLAIVGAIAAIAAVSGVMEATLPGLLGLGAGLLLIGAGVALIGTGIFLLAGGIAALGASTTAGIGAVTTILSAFILLIPELMVQMVKGIIDGFDEITKEMPRIVKIISRVLDGVLSLLYKYTPKFIDFILTTLMNVIKGVINRVPELIEYLGSMIGPINQAMFDFFVDWINGIASVFTVENAVKLKDAIKNLVFGIIDFVKELFGINSPSTVFLEIGQYIIEGLINGIVQTASGIWDWMKEIGSNMINGLLNGLSNIASEAWETIKSVGSSVATAIHDGLSEAASLIWDKMREIVQGIIDAIQEKLEDLGSAAKAIVTAIKDAIVNKFEDLKELGGKIVKKVKNGIKGGIDDMIDIGKNVIEGFVQGIEEKYEKIKKRVKKFFEGITTTVKDVLGIESPSKVFAEIGRYSGSGFVKGLESMASDVYSTASDVGTTAASMLQDAWNAIDDLDGTDVNAEPVISPVVDLSNFNSTWSKMNSLVSSRTMAVSGSISTGITGLAELNQNGINVNNDNVVSAINSLKSDIAKLGSAVSRLQIVMDSGTLVGAILDPMDDALGQKLAYNKRGM